LTNFEYIYYDYGYHGSIHWHHLNGFRKHPALSGRKASSTWYDRSYEKYINGKKASIEEFEDERI